MHSSRKPAEVITFILGCAPEVVCIKFQEFCSNFTSLTYAVNSLLEMNKNLVNKYGFLPLRDDTPILVRPTTTDDPQELRNVIIKLHECDKKAKNKSVSAAIEELLMSSPRPMTPAL